MENIIFEAIDKTGRKIRLTKRQYEHIMKKHSYMSKYIEEIKETLRYPDKIVFSSKYNKMYYYKCYKNLRKPNKFILVIVRYLNGEGFVISTYLESKIK